MHSYYDTGALVPLYVEEIFSDAVTAYVESRDEAIALNLLQQVEMENALRLKVFRGEMDDRRCRAVLDMLRSNLEQGKLNLRAVNWIDALEEARRISRGVTAKRGCRTLDIIHVAIAGQWECKAIVTADDRQIEAARFAGLSIVDLRDVRGKM